MGMRKAVASAILALAVIPSSSYGVSNVGTAGAQFLKIGVGARAEGLGQAFVAIANDISAVYWNPAGLAQLKKAAVMATRTAWIADISHNFVAASIPTRYGMFAGSITNLGSGPMEMTTVEEPEGLGLEFPVGDTAISLTYARGLTDRFSVGITGKHVSQRIHNETASGFAVDIGTFYRTGFGSLRIGMALSNFGPAMRFVGQDLRVEHLVFPDTTNPPVKASLDSSEFPLPMNFRIGMAYDLISDEKNRLTIALDGNHPIDNNERICIGLEYSLLDLFFARVGYKIRVGKVEEEEGLSAGIGVKGRMGVVSVTVDYAYTDFGRLSSSHRLSLGMEF
jgi:hypothetical protein